MRNAGLILLILAATAAAAPSKAIQRSLARAEGDLAKATAALIAADKEKTVSKRLRKLDRVSHHYRSARRIARSTLPRADKVLRPSFVDLEARATRGLVNLLNEQTLIYWARRSVSTARKRNAEALKLLPKDPEALRLRELMKRKIRERDDSTGYEPGYESRRADRNRSSGLNHRLRQHNRRAGTR